MSVDPKYCIHDYHAAINLANGYGFWQCVLCGRPRPDLLISQREHDMLVSETDDGKEYTPSAHRLAVMKIKQQPYF